MNVKFIPALVFCGLLGFGFLPAESTPAQALLVLAKSDNILAIVDPSSLKVVARVPVGPDPHEVIASADGKFAYVSNYGGGAYNTFAVVDLVAQKALPPVNPLKTGGNHGAIRSVYPSTFIPADNAHIQYFGRWDTTDALHPRHSWPGVQIYAEFSGSSIGVRLIDNTNFYNVYIDGLFHSVFHGDKSSEADYVLVDGLKDTRHTLLFSKRNISFDKIFTFSGFLLDDGASLFPPPPKPERKIEFIGDSFTAAEGNEAQEQMMPWEKKFPVTNIDKGFAADIARHFKAQYHTTCRSGIGMVCDWQGKFDIALPKRFDRTLMEASEPKWDFKEWIPDLVVICLGLNDSSGLKEKTGEIPEEQSAIFRKGYHDFLATIRGVYPNVRILAVAAHPEWIRNNVRQVVDEEAAEGHADVFYTQFDYFPGGYVANGHPTVETHQKIADQIIKGIDAIKLFAEREK